MPFSYYLFAGSNFIEGLKLKSTTNIVTFNWEKMDAKEDKTLRQSMLC